MAGSLAEARSHNVPADAFLRHYREIRSLKDAVKDATAAVARAKKAAKAGGINLGAFKLLEHLAELDTDEAELELRDLARYAKWIDLPIGMQGDFFGQPEAEAADAKTAQEQREWQAGEDGMQAGKTGTERQPNPFDAGSAEFAAWDRSWLKGHKVWLAGQKKIAGEMADAVHEMHPKANGEAPPRKRGRPPASGKSENAML